MELLDVPYEQNDDAKRMGAHWDPKQKSWYTKPGDQRHADLLSRWGRIHFQPVKNVPTDHGIGRYFQAELKDNKSTRPSHQQSPATSRRLTQSKLGFLVK